MDLPTDVNSCEEEILCALTAFIVCRDFQKELAEKGELNTALYLSIAEKCLGFTTRLAKLQERLVRILEWQNE
jgi:hypothetical protein